MKQRSAAFEALTPLRQWLLLTAMTAVSGLCAAWLTNQVVTAEVFKRALARAYMPVLSADYGRSNNRAPVTIVSLDDADLVSLGLTWPLHLDYYGRLIRHLARYEPKGIFLDVVFLDTRPEEEVEALVRAACDAATLPRPVPIYIASLNANGRISTTEEKLLAATGYQRLDKRGSDNQHDDGDEKAARTRKEKHCVTRVAANLRSDTFDRSTWEYPLKTAYETTSEPGKFLQSPALAMACQGGQLNAKAEHELCDTDKVSSSANLMALKWPLNPPPINEDLSLRPVGNSGLYAPTCRATTHLLDYFPPIYGVVYRMRNAAFAARVMRLLGLGDWFHRVNMLPCPYTLVVPVRALSGQGLSEADVGKSLTHRNLLIGTDFQSSGDTIYSPVQGPLAGVHAHAMALDNVLAYQDHWKRSGEFEFRHPLTRVSLFTIAMVTLLSAIISAVHVRWRKHSAEHSRIRSAPFDRLINRDISIRSGSVLKDGIELLVRLTVFAKIFVLHVVSFGRLPALPNGSTWYAALFKLLLAATLALSFPYVVAWFGDLFDVGPLSVVEYMLFPFLLELFDQGERLSAVALAAWGAAAQPKSAQWFRRLLSSEKTHER